MIIRRQETKDLSERYPFKILSLKYCLTKSRTLSHTEYKELFQSN